MKSKRSLLTKRKVMELAKIPTGIKGVDEITSGGLPKGRTTLISGNAGCGKTIFALEVLINGALRYDEPGLFISFEETPEELIKNVASMGVDLKQLIKQQKIVIDFININRGEFLESGNYNLDGLFIRLEHQVKKFGIKRIAIDTIETLFTNLTQQSMLRSELQRLFRWLKTKNLTSIITAESDKHQQTRFGLEEFVADCVIQLDHRIDNQISTRRLRFAKYRGSTHGTNEYPFIINKDGILVLPITSLSLDYEASNLRISSGVARLDNMLEGKGYYRGSSVLISGVAGTGKSSFSAAFANSICRNGQRCLYISFEESVSQITRNMKSIGIDLKPWIKKDLLRFFVTRPYSCGLETHLVTIYGLINSFKPQAVVIDPISNLKSIDSIKAVKAVFARLIDFLKTQQITTVLTSLLVAGDREAVYEENISSLMDTWILLQNIEIEGEHNRSLSICKSRGMKHSNQRREILLSKEGINLVDVFVGGGKVLSGAARIAQTEKEKIEKILLESEYTLKKHKFAKKCQSITSQIEALKTSLEIAKEEMNQASTLNYLVKEISQEGQHLVSKARMADKHTKKSLPKNKEGK
jgi:circadian clock protein KaiC